LKNQWALVGQEVGTNRSVEGKDSTVESLRNTSG
jgi:hypothetical protein